MLCVAMAPDATRNRGSWSRTRARRDHEHHHTLGRSALQVSRLGIGAMTWGHATGIQRWLPAQSAYGGAHGPDEEQRAFAASLAAGVTFFDTAAMYSGGASEQRLGELAHGRAVVLATKFPPSPVLGRRQPVARAR